jgi:hypothetical protein
LPDELRLTIAAHARHSQGLAHFPKPWQDSQTPGHQTSVESDKILYFQCNNKTGTPIAISSASPLRQSSQP